jgi:hypothetical protein
MLSRALSLAAVLLLIGSFAPKPALAQENLDAGKTPSQLFAGTCNACHKSPRGLLKTVPPSSLPSFLRQHYTTSPNMAGALASYLVSNGATDTRIGGDGPKGAKGAKDGTKEGARQQEAKQEARPEPRGQSEQLDRWGRRVHPQEANAPPPEPRPEGVEPTFTDRGPDGRKNAKQKLTKRGRPGEALPKEEPPAAIEPPKTDSRPDKPDETAGREDTKPDTAKPAEDDRSQSAKVEQPPELRVLRPDPVPPVTPAPPTAPSAAPAGSPSAPSSMPAPAPVQAEAQSPVTEMAVPLPASPTPPAPPPVAASAPPQPPMPPAGPPAPPISQ